MINKWKPGQLVTLKQENKITQTVRIIVCRVVKCEYACTECPLKKFYVAIAKVGKPLYNNISYCTLVNTKLQPGTKLRPERVFYPHLKR